MCLAQVRNTVTLVRLEPAVPGSRVKHSTTEPLCSLSLQDASKFRLTVQSLYNTHHYNMDLDITLSSCGSQHFLPCRILQRNYRKMTISSWSFSYNSFVNNSEYDQEIPQSQTADKPVATVGRATQQSRDTRKTNKAKQPALSSPLR